VYSPVRWTGLTAGALAALGRGVEEQRAKLEATLRVRYGAADVVLTDSGTSALRLAIQGSVPAGRAVAIPGYSCYDIVTAVVGADADVIFYDVAPDTLGPDPASLAGTSAMDPGAVVACHLFGHLVDLSAVADTIGDTLLIEDAAQGVGGTLHGKPLGSFGSVSVLSFGRGKGMTGGGGGALLAHDERGLDVVAKARASIASDGGSGWKTVLGLAGQLVLGRPSVYGIPSALPFLHLGETRYHEPSEPRGPTRASVAVLETIGPLVERELPVRRKHADRLGAALAESPKATGMKAVANGCPGYLRLPVVARAAVPPDEIRAVRPLGIQRGYPRPLPELPAVRGRVRGTPSVPGAEVLAERLLTLPTHSRLRERDLLEIERWLRVDSAWAPERES
jgi:dTDP-4-amino-4,6-dideoxygalactose transaminase